MPPVTTRLKPTEVHVLGLCRIVNIRGQPFFSFHGLIPIHTDGQRALRDTQRPFQLVKGGEPIYDRTTGEPVMIYPESPLATYSMTTPFDTVTLTFPDGTKGEFCLSLFAKVGCVMLSEKTPSLDQMRWDQSRAGGIDIQASTPTDESITTTGNFTPSLAPKPNPMTATTTVATPHSPSRSSRTHLETVKSDPAKDWPNRRKALLLALRAGTLPQTVIYDGLRALYDEIDLHVPTSPTEQELCTTLCHQLTQDCDSINPTE